MPRYPYDDTFNPPAPVVPLMASSPVAGSPAAIKALVDSGADITVVPRLLIPRLGLRRVDIVLGSGFAARPVECPVYSALLETEFAAPRITRVLSAEEDYALIGRDLLNQWKVTLDGPERLLEVAESRERRKEG